VPTLRGWQEPRLRPTTPGVGLPPGMLQYAKRGKR
jgi:hypothetical protein